jgi:SAM-dependent methyltransferase
MQIKWTDNLQITHHGEIILSKDGFDVIECSSCGFKHIVPFADETTTEEFYSDKFYNEEKDNYISNHQKDMDWWLIEHNEKYDLFEEYLKEPGRRILDIGSGPGFFLKAGSDRGWDVTGVEPGKAAFKFSRQELNLNVKNVFFCRETFQDFGTFDVIHLNNVLEHVISPIEMVAMAKSILRPEGLLSITTPNDFNPLQNIAVKYFGKKHWWVVPDHHLNYFTAHTLRKLLIARGMTPIFDSSSFPLELFLLMGEDYIENKEIGREIHKKRMTMEKNFHNAGMSKLRREIYTKLGEIGLGRQITIISRKEKES